MANKTLSTVRSKYLDMLKRKGHKIIPSSPLVPENDPTTLFTGSGMQPMIGYLLGEPHPLGQKLADSQKCFRSEDIEEVGDNRHSTFFEMLGNWSLGAYWKEEQLHQFFEFLVAELNLKPERLYVSVFAGDETYAIPKDEESVSIWQSLFASKDIDAQAVYMGSETDAAAKGMQGGRIFYYDSSKNWWSRAGKPEVMPKGEPGGPDSEVFYEFTQIAHDPRFGEHCHPNCDCGRFMEIGNSVFMEYIKNEDGTFTKLPVRNVDFGGGLERLTAACNDNPDVFSVDVFGQMIEIIATQTHTPYSSLDAKAPMRVIADHVRAATFMIADGITPSNKAQGYFLRRLIRRSAVKARQLDPQVDVIHLMTQLASQVKIYYKEEYFAQTPDYLYDQVLTKELNQFARTMKKGMLKFEKALDHELNEHVAFDLFQTYGFPFEVTWELAKQKGIELDEAVFKSLLAEHQKQSRTASAGMFKGGLEDQSEATTKFHTATHLLHQALRQILGTHVQQTGSNITGDRLRFDFTHPEKLSRQQLEQIEQLINQKIKEDLPVVKTIESKNEAIKSGALAFFKDKYANEVSVYTIGRDPKTDWFSKELCGGPHVNHTGEIGPIKIVKEKSAASGTRRIYIQFA